MKKLFFWASMAVWALSGCTRSSDDGIAHATPATDYMSEKERAEYVLHPMELMQNAAAEMQTTRGEVIDLQPTTRYLAFMPRNTQELDLLLERNDLELWGHSVYDPVADADAPEEPVADNRLYAFVEAGTELPEGIEYEVVCEYYNPFADRTGKMDDETAVRLIRRAAELTPSTRAVSVFVPSGRVKMMDSKRIDAPLYRLQILLSYADSNGTVVKQTVETDEQGYYTATVGFPGEADYTINWRVGYYSITLSDTTQLATHTGKLTEETGGNITFSQGGATEHSFRFASIFRMTNTSYRLRLIPPSGMRIACWNQEPMGDKKPSEFIPDSYPNGHIHINVMTTSPRPSDEIMGSAAFAIGEMLFYHGHNKELTRYNKSLQESWAAFIRSYFLDKEYERIHGLDLLHEKIEWDDGTFFYKADPYNMQGWSPNEFKGDNDTPFFIDLYDDYNQADTPNPPYLMVDFISIPDYNFLQELAYNSTSMGEILFTKLNQAEYMTKYNYTANQLAHFQQIYRGM